MRNFRAVLIVFITVMSFFLCGFKKHTKKHSVSAVKQSEISQQKSLDLTVPEKNTISEANPVKLTLVQQNADDSLFGSENNKLQSVELKGQVIMSQEPEAGKTKSADGAGLMINLHP